MNFEDPQFWLLLTTGLALIACGRLVVTRVGEAHIGSYDRATLAALGLTLLLAVSWITFLIFSAVCVFTYATVSWLARVDGMHRKHLWLAILLPIQLLPLLYYKYANFVLNDVFSLQFDTLRHLLIPVGISFYTFQKVAFVLDTVGRGEPVPRFLDYLNFASFFPQIVAGPIERKSDLLPQVERFRWRWDASNIDAGASWIALGLALKLALANNLAEMMVPFTESTTNAYAVWTLSILFGLRIYFDFAGYSLIALGIARCIGLRLTLNFASPYCSTSIQEFWRRWHVTLSNWFRDYVYIPLGGSRTKLWAVSIAAVFLLSGVWHGAGWNFVLWGALHGLYLIIYRVVGRRVSLPTPLAWLVTFLAVDVAWLAFYETNTDRLLAKLVTLATPGAYSPAALLETVRLVPMGDLFTLCVLVGLSTAVIALEWVAVRRYDEPYVTLRHPAVLAGLVVLTAVLAPTESNGFIYFAF